MIYKFSESEEIAIKNRGKFLAKNLGTLRPYLFVRGSFPLQKTKIKYKSLVCGDCGAVLTSKYTKSIGLCAVCNLG